MSDSSIQTYQGLSRVVNRELISSLTDIASCFIQPQKPHDQVIFVLSPHWNSDWGLMQLCSYNAHADWVANFQFPVALGRAGLAWGRGLMKPQQGPQKTEGDNKSPAGAFDLGRAFGYHDFVDTMKTWPYTKSDEYDYFIDDVDSADYNHWVRTTDDPEIRWNSFERMKRDDKLYEFGAVVKHNMDPVEPGAGSAIFMHEWSKPFSPTAGCTAMRRRNIKQLLQWLDADRHPILVQLPLDYFRLPEGV